MQQRANHVAELNQLEQFLQQPDAIMEPNILDVLRRYVSAGGEATVVVEMLSDNYVGKRSSHLGKCCGRLRNSYVSCLCMHCMEGRCGHGWSF